MARRARRCSHLVLALALGCASPAPPETRAPQPTGTPLPADLALAVRVDLGSLRAELGQDLARQVLRDAFTRDADASVRQPPALPLLERALSQADVLWLGYPSIAPDDPDSILLLRGHFASLAPTEPGAGWSRDASGTATLELPGDGVAGYERVYRPPGEELLAWSPSSAWASVERALHGPSPKHPMRPPERGALSIAARPEPLLERYAARYPELTERFRGVQRVEAFAEPSTGAWRADLSLDFDTPEHARDASLVAERVREALAKRTCAMGALARAIEISTFERSLRVKAALLGADLDAVRACVLGGGCCA